MEETYKTDLQPNRMYKARLFEMIFSDKKELLKLYNAVNQSHYTDPDELEINTLENAIYLSMHNDISFVIHAQLSLYEHQSTYNPNLPLRCLMYVSDLYSDMTKDKNLYGKKVVEIPPPRFVIFYNGSEERPERELLKLSDAYTIPQDHPALELETEFVNINPGRNEVLLNTCKTLRDYSEYSYRVRTYSENMEIEDAVERAITECIREDILKEFLEKFRAEAKKVSIYEYDEERQRQFDKAEGREEGWSAGRTASLAEAVMKFLRNLGTVPETVEERIYSETDEAIFQKWIELAVRANSVEEFVENSENVKMHKNTKN